jgi:glucose-6-phosphate isomerase
MVKAAENGIPMKIKHSIDACLDQAIGAAGVSQSELNRWLDKLGPRLERLRVETSNRSLPHIRILYERDDIAEARAAYARLAEGARTIVIFGTGGSSLGGQALAQASGWALPGDDHAHPDRPHLQFYDNLDAASLVNGLDALDLASTRFIVISKSGGTAETLSQTITVLSRIKAAGLGSTIPAMFLGVTEPEIPGVANGLRSLFTALRIPMLPHPTDIGGRFSAFTTVGLLPAIARGMDVEAFRAGAASVVEALATAKTSADFAPALGAALNVAFAKEKGVNVSVLMPYSDRLACFSDWYVQLWAESLGKNNSEGTTPVGALGPVDQHSQLQLYLGGAQHHLTTIIRSSMLPASDTMPMDAELAGLAGASYLAGHTIGELVMAQTRAITDAFTASKRPVRIIELSRVDEWSLGWLMMHYVIETILAADLMGVDPFDQPAVELGKRLTKEYLARMAVGETKCHAHRSTDAATDKPNCCG